jgi:hypothetical protein
MMLEKQCLVMGRNSEPSFGKGLPSQGKMLWACSIHRHELDGPPKTDAVFRIAKTDHKPLQPAQGRLL